MRKADREIKDPNRLRDFLRAAVVGRLATLGPDGFPMIKPVNFVWEEGVIYFHSALAGEKIEHLQRDDRVCFEADLPIAYVKADEEEGCRASYLYRSVVVKGRARLVADPGEKVRALRLLLAKYQGPGDYRMAPERVDGTGVVRISVESMTGKELLGKGRIREEAERALASGGPFPVILEAD